MPSPVLTHSHSHGQDVRSRQYVVGADLNIHQCLLRYIKRALTHVAGLKSLLLDAATHGIVGLVYRYSDLLQAEAFLVEDIDLLATRKDLQEQSLSYLTALVIVQPSEASLSSLQVLLGSPRYNAYHIFFTNRLPSRDYIDRLARYDRHGYVCSVHEYYMDYYAVSPVFFHVNNTSMTAAARASAVWDRSLASLSLAKRQDAMFDRDCQGLIALLLALKRRPDIRYAASSSQASTLALQVSSLIGQNSELFPFQHEPTLLLVLDRRDDPVTPLLTQWTYQAMVHELFGIHNNRIDLKGRVQLAVSDGNKRADLNRADLSELVLSEVDDEFFAANQHSNFGELGSSLRSLFQRVAQTRKEQSNKFTSIAAMQEMLDQFPQIRAQNASLSKHMTLTDCLQKEHSDRHLLTVSEIEQEIVCGNAPNHSTLCHRISKVLDDQRVDDDDSEDDSEHRRSQLQLQQPRIPYLFYDKLRLVLLYALRYGSHEHSQLANFKQLLTNYALDSRDRASLVYIDKILQYYNASNFNTIQTTRGVTTNRRAELFETNKVLGLFRAIKSDVVGIDNIFTQHKPLMINTVKKLFEGDLSHTQYPFTDSGHSGEEKRRTRYRQLIVYVLGGVTFEEYAQLDTLMHRLEIDYPNNQYSKHNGGGVGADSGSSSDRIVQGIGAPPAPVRSTSSDSLAVNSLTVNSKLNAGAKKLGAEVFGAVTKVGSTLVGTAANAAGAVLPKFNPKEFRAILGGSCIHNSRSFLHELHPISEDFTGGKLRNYSGAGASASGDGTEVSNIEMAVNRHNATLRGRGGGGPPRGRGGRGAPRGRGRGGYHAVSQQAPGPTGMQRARSAEGGSYAQ